MPHALNRATAKRSRPSLSLGAAAASGVCLLLAACASDPGVGSGRSSPPPRQAGDSYFVTAQAAVATRSAATQTSRRARNVILFVGDGMGVSSVTAGRIYAGQAKGLDGESYRLTMEQLAYSAFSKTYTHDSQVADSAPTATAMTAGVKSYNGTLGVTQAADLADCRSARGAATDTLWEMVEEAGLATGVVSTARLTHATPAATYAKTTERDWESDADVSVEGKSGGCADIATQFIAWQTAHGDGFEVALAGGRAQFLPESVADPEYPDRKGARKDGRNLAAEWAAMPGHSLITDRAGFAATNFASEQRILGLFEPSHMQYELDRAKPTAPGKGEPSLAEMTRAAITRLSRDSDGYLLMVEAGRIDHGHHAGNAARALADLAALDEAVAAARVMVDTRDTLILVTADHSHVLSIAGYPARNNPILGLVRERAGGPLTEGRDGKPYTTLGYANGPGAICNEAGACDRRDLETIDTTGADFLQQATVPLGSETHGGEDVPVFAEGPGAELVRGVIEQNEIFHIMARSLALGG